MPKQDTYFARLAAYTDVITHGGMVEQVGAICLRKDTLGSAKVLLITTRETGRWTIPKGWPIKGLKSHEAAEREAWEEAGVKGKARKGPLATSLISRRLMTEKRYHPWSVYILFR